MKLAFSNIAWRAEEESQAVVALSEHGIKYVELAPTKYWNDPTIAPDDEAAERVDWWKQHGLAVVAFQSMLFLRPDLKIFESEENREQTLAYMKRFLVLAGKMGASRLVFGSPKNRQLGKMDKDEAMGIAIDFFRELGAEAESNGVMLCIEPNAPQYACDFVTTAKEGSDLVRAINSPGIGLHLDTACMQLAGDDIERSIRNSIDILEHFHISAPMLETVGPDSGIDYESILQLLKDLEYDKVVSIEMKPSEGDNVERVRKTAVFITDLLSN